MLKILLVITFMTGSALEARQMEFSKFIDVIKNQQGTDQPPLKIHSRRISRFIKLAYTKKDLDKLTRATKSAVEIKVHRNGLIQASDRPLNSKDDPTHYDAVWVRDTLWAYLGLQAQNKNDLSLKVLNKIFDYFSSPDQLRRLSNVILHPEVINGPGGAMEVLHIRFDGESKTFQDVQVGGQPQKWNHKQNDAVGLFYDLTLRAIESGAIPSDTLSAPQLQLLASLPAYFSQTKFYEMEDAGSWEEIEKVATSSVGLVTSSLEELLKIVNSKRQKDIDFIAKLRKVAANINLESYMKAESLNDLLTKGYSRIQKQIKAGGESPLYKTGDPRYRLADAALLNLIYPGRLGKLSNLEKVKILNLVSPLIGAVGIKRYLGDSYQSGNFWFQASANTTDNSSAQAFTDRAKGLISHSEAQWFFDSWFSKCAGVLLTEANDPSLRNLELLHLNRALSQLTGGNIFKKFLSADGENVAPFALPESYNVIANGKSTYFAPSPITPLNWAKASLSIAIEEMKSH